MKEPFEVRRTKISSGMKVVTARRDKLPVFYAVLVLHGGSVYDPPGKNGVAELVSRFLEKDTLNFTRREISNLIEGLGGWIVSDSGHYTQQIKLGLISRFAHHGLSMMAEMAMNTKFTQEELEKERKKLISEHNDELTVPSEVLSYAFNSAIYHNHPLGAPSDGVVETIQKITLDDLISFHRNHFCPSNAFLVAVSDIPHEEVVSMAENSFGSWKCDPKPALPELPKVAPIKGKHAIIVDMKISQAFIALGHHAPMRNDPIFNRLVVANFAIGGGRELSRMMREIRIKNGLAYSAYSVLKGGLKAPGVFAAQTETKAETATDALKLTLDIIRDVHEHGITEEELTMAKSFFQGAIPRMAESNKQIASALINCELYGLQDFYWIKEIEEIASLSLDDVSSAVREHIDPDNFVMAVVADTEKFKPEIHGITFDKIRVLSPDDFKTLRPLED